MMMAPKRIALYFWLDSGIYVADLAELLDATFVRVLRMCWVIVHVLVHDTVQEEDDFFREVGYITACLCARSLSNR
jgi:hypothetical protein